MLMKKNVNNDTSKDLPIQDHRIRGKKYKICAQLCTIGNSKEISTDLALRITCVLNSISCYNEPFMLTLKIRADIIIIIIIIIIITLFKCQMCLALLNVLTGGHCK